MALQLIDLGNEVEVVEIDTSKVPYTFSVKLTDKTYTFTVKYNEAGGFFTVDLATSDGEPLVYGEAVNLAGTDGIYTIAANERYRMQYRQETTGIEILDAAGMPLWSSTADRERYDWMTASDVWRQLFTYLLYS